VNRSVNWIEHAAPGVPGLVPYAPGKPISELARELGLDPAGIIKLASNENPLGASPLAVAAARRALDEVHLYPDGACFDLKRALAHVHGVAPEQCVIGNGSNEVLELIARAFLAPGRQALFATHAFAVYPIVTQAAGAEAVITPVRAAGQERPFAPDLAAMAAAVTERTRVVFVANPNNPTGAWNTAQEVRGLLRALPPTVIAVLDEAYHDYVTAADYQSATAWLGEFPNLIVTRTFSKIYGLAGLRAGYGLCAPELAAVLERVREPFNVNLPAQAAATAALGDHAFVQASVRANTDGMRQWEQGLRHLGLGWIPSAGNFLCVELGRDAAPVYQALLRAGVIVRPVANYGLPRHLRVTIGTAEQNARCLVALASTLAGTLAA
jgi:histidinol-phosphate aminotransferase